MSSGGSEWPFAQQKKKKKIKTQRKRERVEKNRRNSRSTYVAIIYIRIQTVWHFRASKLFKIILSNERNKKTTDGCGGKARTRTHTISRANSDDKMSMAWNFVNFIHFRRTNADCERKTKPHPKKTRIGFFRASTRPKINRVAPCYATTPDDNAFQTDLVKTTRTNTTSSLCRWRLKADWNDRDKTLPNGCSAE